MNRLAVFLPLTFVLLLPWQGIDGLSAAGPGEFGSISRRDPLQKEVPTPEQEDATLHDVRFIGTRLGIAVGDRGVIWRTEDGGDSWRFIKTPTSGHLQGLCLLTDRIGWAVGREIAPDSRLSTGILLRTLDGGLSWTEQKINPLPGLAGVQFFDLKHGCVIGDSTARGPSGIWWTDDGGVTWQPALGEKSAGWQTVAFFNEQTGAVAGNRGRQGVIGNKSLLPLRTTPTLRGLHDIAISRSGRGWMVGDGAFIRTTTDRGVSWPEPDGLLPNELRDLQDFHAVACHGDQVWVAGSPGSVIWHSPDAGRTWHPQQTMDPTPLRALAMTSETNGVAVGVFGRIIKTRDGGRHWHPVRGASRRPAVLSLHAGAERIPFDFLARYSAEEGYRSIVALLARRDVGSDAHAHEHLAQQLRAAVLAAGGNDSEINWKLPVTLPELERQRDELLAEWSRVTDQRLPQVMLGGLVAWLRTWRPEVVMLDDPPAEDQLTRLLHEVVLLAVEQAADPTRFPEQLQLLDLPVWRTSQVLSRRQGAVTGDLRLARYQILPRQGATIQQVAAQAASRLSQASPMEGPQALFRLVRSQTGRDDAPAEGVPFRGLFGGKSFPPGADVRRELKPIRDVDLERLEQLARHRRNFETYAERVLDDPRMAAQLIGQLRETTRPLPPDQAARLLADLAREYRKRSNWPAVEETLVELVDRYPEQPPARAAMRWLLAFWTSAEINYHRMKSHQVQSPRLVQDGQLLNENLQKAIQAAHTSENPAQLQMELDQLPSPITVRQQPGALRKVRPQEILQTSGSQVSGSLQAAGIDPRADAVRRKIMQADRLLDILRVRDQALFETAEIQFLRASLLRKQLRPDAAAKIYRTWFGLEDHLDVWNVTARGEIWTQVRRAFSPKPVLRCRYTSQPPVLDGILGEDCWVAAEEIPLTGQTGRSRNETFIGGVRLKEGAGLSGQPLSQGPRAIVMMAYDDRFLYVAASVPRVAGVSDERPQLAGREYDADLHSFDRLGFCFDIDRDYATYYRFEVDQRGWTRDALWEDQRWNPRWYVAADADGRGWRVEIAIPLEELMDHPPRKGDVWSGGVTRVIPARGVQSWTQPAGETVRAETFGLILFD